MSNNLTTRFLAETQAAINAAVSISDVTRIARVYRFGARHELRDAILKVRAENYTAADVAWFRSPVGAL